MKLNSRGQGLVETLLGLPLIFLVTVGMALLLYRALVFHYVDYQLHEALICMQSEEVRFCQRELENRMSKILLPGATSRIQMMKSWNSSQGKAQIILKHGPDFLHAPLKIQKSLPRTLR